MAGYLPAAVAVFVAMLDLSYTDHRYLWWSDAAYDAAMSRLGLRVIAYGVIAAFIGAFI